MKNLKVVSIIHSCSQIVECYPFYNYSHQSWFRHHIFGLGFSRILICQRWGQSAKRWPRWHFFAVHKFPRNFCEKLNDNHISLILLEEEVKKPQKPRCWTGSQNTSKRRMLTGWVRSNTIFVAQKLAWWWLFMRSQFAAPLSSLHLNDFLWENLDFGPLKLYFITLTNGFGSNRIPV